MNQNKNNPILDFQNELKKTLLLSNVVILYGNRCYDKFLCTIKHSTTGCTDLKTIIFNSINFDHGFHFDPSRGNLTEFAKKPKAGQNIELESKSLSQSTFGAIEAINFIYNRDSSNHNNGKILLTLDCDLLFDEFIVSKDDHHNLISKILELSRNMQSRYILAICINSYKYIPSLLKNSNYIKKLRIPSLSHLERLNYLQIFIKANGKAYDDQAILDLSKKIKCTLLEELQKAVHITFAKNLPPNDALSFLGNLISKENTSTSLGWSNLLNLNKLSELKTKLEEKIVGQPHAISQIYKSLQKSALGLNSAFSTSLSDSPRAVLFFSGPTGTGKTECAKIISKIIYGNEEIDRIDCAELGQEHAIERLIGAPPGYIGFDSGSHFLKSNSIDQKGVILFDEIDKAHPRIFNVLLGILDHGILTTGSGEVVKFHNSIIIFTSNYGTENINNLGEENDFNKFQKVFRTSIENHFSNKLKKPEFIGRIGGPDGIVVFDQIRLPNLLMDTLLQRFQFNIKKSLGIEIQFHESIIESLSIRYSRASGMFQYGGRWIATQLEKDVLEKLIDFLEANLTMPTKISAQFINGVIVFQKTEKNSK